MIPIILLTLYIQLLVLDFVHHQFDLILSILSSTQNSSQITDDDNEKYYSAQSSKISTPMVHSITYRKNSDEKLILSSIFDLNNDEQKQQQQQQQQHQTKILPPQNENKNILH